MTLAWVLLGALGWVLFAWVLRRWVLARRRVDVLAADVDVALRHLLRGDAAGAQVVLDLSGRGNRRQTLEPSPGTTSPDA